MKIRPLFVLALALAACTTPPPAGGPGAEPSAAASATPTPDPDPPIKPEDFKPTALTLEVDGKAVPILRHGFLSIATDTLLAGSLGVYRSESRGTTVEYAPSFNVASAGKAVSDPAFTKADAKSLLIGMNWVKGTTARTFTPEAAATVTLAVVDGKLDLTYTGKMIRATGTGEFPERIEVKLVATGIPTRK